MNRLITDFDRTSRAVNLLFLISGFTALAYQLIWFKRFSHVWGSSALAMSAVVASFLLGLGLGAFLCGLVAQRFRNALFVYGIIEIVIALLAILVPFEIVALSAIQVPDMFPAANQVAILFVLRIILTVIVIGPPCVLMGATLPILVKYIVDHRTTSIQPVSRLYGINTLGAAIGCAVAGFYLLPALGVFWTNILIAFINFAIGSLAICIATLQRKAEKMTSTMYDEPLLERFSGVTTSTEGPGAMYVVSALSGLAALSLEMAWARQLSLVLGGSTYAFSATLFIVLVGIGLGSLVYERSIKSPAFQRNWPLILAASIAIGCIAGQLILPDLCYLAGIMRPLRANFFINAVFCVVAAATLQLIPAFSIGVLFPLCVDKVRQNSRASARAVGNVYAANTIGSTFGALLPTVFFIPSIGASRLITSAAIVYCLMFVIFFKYTAWATVHRLAIVFCLVVLAAFRTFHEVPTVMTNSGFYLYGPTPDSKEPKVLFFEEGANSNVLVMEHEGGARTLRVNGKVDASNSGDMSMQFGLGLFPLLLRPESKEICIIGYGSGATTGTCLLFPNTSVTCCEIESNVFLASRLFADVNHSSHTSQRVSMVFDDGRNYLKDTRKTFDLILSEPSNPWIAGVSNLFTREFYELTSNRLNKDGILVQWIQTYGLTDVEYSLILRTMKCVFPYTGLFRISAGDTIVFASHTQWQMDELQLRKGQNILATTPLLNSDALKYFGSTDVKAILLGHYVLDDIGITQLANARNSKLINTDQNITLEFEAPRYLFHAEIPDEMKPDRAILRTCDSAWFENIIAMNEFTEADARVISELAVLFESVDRIEVATALVERGLEKAPDNPYLLAARIRQHEGSGAMEFRIQAEAIAKKSTSLASTLGVNLWQAKRFDDAAIMFELLTQLEPESINHWVNLGINYFAAGRVAPARDAFDKAYSLDPYSDFVRASIREFELDSAKKQRRLVDGAEGE